MKKIIIKVYSFFQRISGFKKLGKSSIIKRPSKIWNKRYIEIGNHSFIAENSFFAISKTANKIPKIKIGDNCCIGANFFVACIDEIIIGNNVLMSDRVFISDHIHDYSDIKIPIIKQNLKPKGKVLIKDGSFIGINAVLMPGVTIGKNSVVGASSVVTKDVPDYCVAIGNPAKVIKNYDFQENKWKLI